MSGDNFLGESSSGKELVAESLAPEHSEIACERALLVPMRDGVVLYADVYRPRGATDEETLPVLLMRLPYGREIASTVVYAHPSWYASQGFIVVIQEVRGCGQSEGEFYPMQPQEMEDGLDTLKWCQNLPGSNGRVGMYGFSYQGITQFQALAAGGKQWGLKAIAPAMAAINFYRGWCYWGGAFALNLAVPWGIQLAQDQAQFQKLEPDATELAQGRSQLDKWLNFTPLEELEILRDHPTGQFFFDWVRETCADSEYYQRHNPESYLKDNCHLPGLHIAGWADAYLDGTLHAYEWMVKNSDAPQWLVVGPWQHLPWSRRVGEMDFGPEASPDIDRLQVKWFKQWLSDENQAFDGEPRVQLFEMGRNQWRTVEQWPPVSQSQEFWLSSDGLANGPDSSGQLVTSAAQVSGIGFDTYVCDPRITPSSTPYGPYNRSAVQMRPDLLLYSSVPLEQGIAIAGVPVLHLYASSSAPDTDWVVTLTRVSPEGKAILMSAGILRARFRHSFSRPELLTPDQIESYQIPLRATCWHVPAGYQIRVAISSNGLPWGDRNPQTGQWPASANWSDIETATQTIFHSRNHPSRLELPFLSIGKQ